MADAWFKQALRERRILIGSWLQINNPTAAEVLASAGSDWIAVDIEHTDIDITSLTELLRGMYGRGAAPIARVASNTVMDIRRALDAGAAGVLVPFVNSAEQARQAVAAAKYPPMGVRGFSFSRANNWGADFAEDARTANDATMAALSARQGGGTGLALPLRTRNPCTARSPSPASPPDWHSPARRRRHRGPRRPCLAEQAHRRRC